MISLVNGMFWPYGNPPSFGVGVSTSLDALNEYVAFIGRLSIEGKATGKTLDTTGSSKVFLNTGSPSTFLNGSSRFRAGLQGVDTAALPVRPNGTWKVYAEASTANDFSPSLTTDGAAVSKTPTYYDGSSTFSHGDLVAFVCQLTVLGGTDSVQVSSAVSTSVGASAAAFPCCVTNISGSPAVMSGIPACSIVFSDGTLGYIDRGGVGLVVSNIWDSANNPSERGEIFQVPFGCTIDALMFSMRVVDAASDWSVALYSDPTGTTPVEEIAPITLAAETLAAAGAEGIFTYTLTSDFTLLAETDYCLVVKALGTGASDTRFGVATLGHADQRKQLWPAKETAKGATRNGSGPFTPSDTTHYPVGVRISSIDAGSAGGGMRMAGHGGLAA